MDSDTQRPLLRHGILKQRTADVLTDALRALALQICGYRTDVVQFVSPEATAKNIMIRAVEGGPVADLDRVREYLELKSAWKVDPAIERLLGARFLNYIED